MFSSTTPQRLKPRDKDYFEPDSDGLSLKVRTTGRKIWTVRYWQNGKEYRKKIGEYPLMSLLEARQIRDGMKIRVRSGQAATDVSSITFRGVAQEWFTQFRVEKSQKHVDTVQYRLEHYIYPVIGQVPIANMERLVFTNLLLSISATGKVETARRVAWIIQQVMEFAVGRGFMKAHEAHKLTKVLPKHAAVHFANTKKEELLGALLRAIEGLTSPVPRAALLVTAYCFPRVSELLAATWSEIDLDAALWTIPAEHVKRDRELLVPLPWQVVKILHELREYLDSCLYAGKDMSKKRVFPAQRPTSGRTGDVAITEGAMLMNLRRIHQRNPDIPRVTNHGFRHTASTLLHKHGENTLWIEEQMSHLDPNKVRSTYNSWAYVDERRGMLQRYADFLDSLRDGGNKLNGEA